MPQQPIEYDRKGMGYHECWAEFFKKAGPYEMSGELGSGWRSVVDSTRAEGEAVIARALLEHYQASVGRNTVLGEKAAIAEQVKEAGIAAIVTSL